MPGLPTGPAAGAAAKPQMSGMPSEAEMQQMFQGMMAQGMDLTSMDHNQFMQLIMGGGAGMMGQNQPPTGPQVGYGEGGGRGGFDQGGGGFGGREEAGVEGVIGRDDFTTLNRLFHTNTRHDQVWPTTSTPRR
jgi:hypothetical protein